MIQKYSAAVHLIPLVMIFKYRPEFTKQRAESLGAGFPQNAIQKAAGSVAVSPSCL